MATDYDAPRTAPEDEPVRESLEEIRAQRNATAQTPILEDDDDTAESIDLPDADLIEENLTIQVIPERENEFVCASCFLVHHRSQLAREGPGAKYCTDCDT
ncbi:dUTPase [Kocuria flava]|uniref:dUTPase n=2 Tax=Kocuria TaxID=57493 RepID=A0A0U3G9A2_9MICC|nr:MULTISPECIES: DUF4193 domain-containing protein [Kocuria]ALU39675.1 dUTPase [Kocuria flava]GEO92306.1 dUTPase [Kocuria flava]GEO97246.1 dUTPase [Kocuria turfanensis]